MGNAAIGSITESEEATAVSNELLCKQQIVSSNRFLAQHNRDLPSAYRLRS